MMNAWGGLALRTRFMPSLRFYFYCSRPARGKGWGLRDSCWITTRKRCINGMLIEWKVVTIRKLTNRSKKSFPKRSWSTWIEKRIYYFHLAAWSKLIKLRHFRFSFFFFFSNSSKAKELLPWNDTKYLRCILSCRKINLILAAIFGLLHSVASLKQKTVNTA